VFRNLKMFRPFCSLLIFILCFCFSVGGWVKFGLHMAPNCNRRSPLPLSSLSLSLSPWPSFSSHSITRRIGTVWDKDGCHRHFEGGYRDVPKDPPAHSLPHLIPKSLNDSIYPWLTCMSAHSLSLTHHTPLTHSPFTNSLTPKIECTSTRYIEKHCSNSACTQGCTHSG